MRAASLEPNCSDCFPPPILRTIHVIFDVKNQIMFVRVRPSQRVTRFPVNLPQPLHRHARESGHNRQLWNMGPQRMPATADMRT